MWYPVILKLEGFRSFTKEEYLFKKGSFLIQGINKTEIEEAESNGSGKSSLREALCYVLGLPTFSDTITDLINDKGTKECKVSLELRNSLTKQKLKIVRATPLKGSTVLQVKLNKEDQKEKFATVRDGDKLIIQLIGISKEDLLNHYIISKEKFTSFFSSSDTKIKELISRFSNFDRIDGVEKIVEDDIKKLNEQLQVLGLERGKLQGKIELLKQDLEQEEKVDPENVKNKRILDLNEKIGVYTEINEKLSKNVQNGLKTIENYKEQQLKEKTKQETLQGEMNSLNEISFEKEIDETKEKKDQFIEFEIKIQKKNTEINGNIKEFNKFKIEVETAIDGSIVCPECLHEFIPKGEIDFKEAQKNLPIILEELKGLTDKIEKNDGELIEIEETLSGYNAKLKGYQKKIDDFNVHKSQLSSKIFQTKREIQRIGSEIELQVQNNESYQKKVNLNKADIESFGSRIKEIEKEEIKTRENEIKENLRKTSIKMQGLNELIQDQKDLIYSKEQWIYRFIKFKSSLANESLEIIQGYANMYLKKMRSNMTVVLEGYKQKKNGDIREKINPIILRDGIQEGSGSFKKYSGGERGKIDIATSVLAVQNLINNSCHTGGLDLIWTDEITESIDSKGLENLVESISELDKFCLITSHVTHKKVHENILTIEKVNGISQIV